MRKVLEEVAAERERQEKKWGEQNHPILDPRDTGCDPDHDDKSYHEVDWDDKVSVAGYQNMLAMRYSVPLEETAKQTCENNFKRGTGTYMDIIIEELCEAIGTLGQEDLLRTELVQTAACIVAAIECLDRKNAKKLQSGEVFFLSEPEFVGVMPVRQNIEVYPTDESDT